MILFLPQSELLILGWIMIKGKYNQVVGVNINYELGMQSTEHSQVMNREILIHVASYLVLVSGILWLRIYLST